MELDSSQQVAIDLCCDLTKRLVAVTGVAGTGKTSIIKMVCQRLEELSISFAICAPTGKAARRITEATGYPATTIHKLLGFNRPEIDQDTGEAVTVTRPSYTRANPLPYKVIIADEYAMVATGLHRDLVEAIGMGVMRVFGDVQQLPPIEPHQLADTKSPFEKCLQKPHTVRLFRVYRQEEGNSILEAARQIADGAYFTPSEDCQRVISETMVKSLYDMVRKEPALWGTTNYQIISPARKTDVGTVKLNAALQLIINPDMKSRLELPRHKWETKKTQPHRVEVAIGDKVVCGSNVYDMRNFNERYDEWLSDAKPVATSYIPCPATKSMLNGEVGIIVAIGIDGTLEIDFGDRIVEIPPIVEEYWDAKQQFVPVDHRKQIELAYALTTHKCQGSEYEEVAYIMARAAFFNLSRANFYTALTRARKRVTVFTDQAALAQSTRMPRARAWKPKGK